MCEDHAWGWIRTNRATKGFLSSCVTTLYLSLLPDKIWEEKMIQLVTSFWFHNAKIYAKSLILSLIQNVRGKQFKRLSHWLYSSGLHRVFLAARVLGTNKTHKCCPQKIMLANKQLPRCHCKIWRTRHRSCRTVCSSSPIGRHFVFPAWRLPGPWHTSRSPPGATDWRY